MSHPELFEPTPTTECSLCHGHHKDGTPYLKLEKNGVALETWDGPTVILCGKCIDAMKAKIGNWRPKEKKQRKKQGDAK